jgi:hypothetical protein
MVHVEKREGKRRYKIVETTTGRVVGSSTNVRDAHISAWKRNQAYERKNRKG